MQIASAKRRGRKPGGQTKFHGICADAKALGVTVSYLWKWRTGAVVSARMGRRWAEYLVSKGKTDAPSKPNQ